MSRPSSVAFADDTRAPIARRAAPVFHGQSDFSAGTLIAIAAGGTSTVEETAIPHGRVTNSDGSPAPQGTVRATTPAQAQAGCGSVTGRPGQYNLFGFATARHGQLSRVGVVGGIHAGTGQPPGTTRTSGPNG